MPIQTFFTVDGNHLCPYRDMTDADLAEFEREMKIPLPTFPCSGVPGCRCASSPTPSWKSVKRSRHFKYIKWWGRLGYALGCIIVGLVYIGLFTVVALACWGIYYIFGG